MFAYNQLHTVCETGEYKFMALVMKPIFYHKSQEELNYLAFMSQFVLNSLLIENF